MTQVKGENKPAIRRSSRLCLPYQVAHVLEIVPAPQAVQLLYHRLAKHRTSLRWKPFNLWIRMYSNLSIHLPITYYNNPVRGYTYQHIKKTQVYRIYHCQDRS